MKRLETCADRLISLAPGRCEGYLYKGLAAYEFDRLDVAQAWMERAVDMAPSGQSIPTLALARVEILRGDTQSAFKRCQQLLLENPSDVHAQELANKLATGSLDAMPD